MSRFVDASQKNISTALNNSAQEKMGTGITPGPGFQNKISYNYCMASSNGTVPIERGAVTVSSIIIPFVMMNRVIGRGGETMKNICYRSGAKCERDHRTPVFCNTLTILVYGTNCQIEHAKSLIRKIAGEVNPITGQLDAGAVHEDAPHEKWKSENRLRQPYPLDDLRYDQLTGLPDFRKQWIDYYAHVGDFDSANALNAEVMADERKLRIQGYQPDRVDWDWQDLEAWQTATKKKIKVFCEKKLTITETFQDMSTCALNFPQVNGYYTNLKVDGIPPCKENLNYSFDNTDNKIVLNDNGSHLQENEGINSLKVETLSKPLVQETIKESVAKNRRQGDSGQIKQSNKDRITPDKNSSSCSKECDELIKNFQFTPVIKGEKHVEHILERAAYNSDNEKVAKSAAIENSIAQAEVAAVTARVQSRKRAGEEIHDNQVDRSDEHHYKEQTLFNSEPIPYKKFCRHSSNEEQESEEEDFDQDLPLKYSGAKFYDDHDDEARSKLVVSPWESPEHV